MTSTHADLLNSLDAMAESPVYALRRDVLRSAESVIVAQEQEIENLRKEIKADADQIRLTAQAQIIGSLEAGIKGKDGIYPDWVYEAREAIKHQNENIPWLPDLLKILGWHGGTVHQAMQAVRRMVEKVGDT